MVLTSGHSPWIFFFSFFLLGVAMVAMVATANHRADSPSTGWRIGVGTSRSTTHRARPHRRRHPTAAAAPRRRRRHTRRRRRRPRPLSAAALALYPPPPSPSIRGRRRPRRCSRPRVKVRVTRHGWDPHSLSAPLAPVALEHEPLIIATAAQGACACVGQTTCVNGGLNRRRGTVRPLGGPHFVPHLGRAWPGNGDGMRLAAESSRTGMESTHGDSAVMRSTTPRRRQVCLELLPASRHHPGGQQGDAGGGVRSDPYCGVWVAALAPTVAHARVSAPHRLVTRPFFHGLAPAAAYTAPCTWPGHAGGGSGCSANKAVYVLERSCSTAPGRAHLVGNVQRARRRLAGSYGAAKFGTTGVKILLCGAESGKLPLQF